MEVTSYIHTSSYKSQRAREGGLLRENLIWALKNEHRFDRKKGNRRSMWRSSGDQDLPNVKRRET